MILRAVGHGTSFKAVPLLIPLESLALWPGQDGHPLPGQKTIRTFPVCSVVGLPYLGHLELSYGQRLPRAVKDLRHSDLADWSFFVALRRVKAAQRVFNGRLGHLLPNVDRCGLNATITVHRLTIRLEPKKDLVRLYKHTITK